MPRPADERESRATPEGLREGVRSALHSALVQDLEQRGGRTGAHLVASGAIGVAGALAVTWLVAGHPLDHHPSWHLMVYSTAWAGLLIVALALALLDVRTPAWPVGRAARTAILALALAGLCARLCPDQHFLAWWSSSDPATWIEQTTRSRLLSVACFGWVASASFALLAALPTLPRRAGTWLTALGTAGFVALLQAPGIALQSTDAPAGTLPVWLAAAGIGAVAGVAGAGALLRRFAPDLLARDEGSPG